MDWELLEAVRLCCMERDHDGCAGSRLSLSGVCPCYFSVSEKTDETEICPSVLAHAKERLVR